MSPRLLTLCLLLPGILSAGKLKLPDGTEIHGTLHFAAGSGVRLTDTNGIDHPVNPAKLSSLSVDATDALWPEELRVTRTNQFGLLGQYYEGTEFKGTPRVRVDTDLNFRWGSGGPMEGWRNDQFSVRWSGHFQVAESDDYEFTTRSDDGVRLFINGKQLIANWSDHSVTENKTHIRLEAGDLNEIRVEYFENSGDAELRVEWAGRNGQRRSLGELILVTDGAGVTESRLPEQAPVGLQTGVVLRDGSFLKARPRRGNDTALELDAPYAGRTVTAFHVARVVFRDIPQNVAAATRPGRQGALLVGADFVDSEFQSLENGILQVSSLLFGQQRLDTKFETHAVLLREPKPEHANWRIRDRSGSVVLADSWSFTANGITVSNAILRELEMPIDTLVEIESGSAAELFPDSLRFGPDSVHAREPGQRRSDDAERRRIDSLKRMAAQEKSRRERELDEVAGKARAEMATLKEARGKVAETEQKHEAAHRDWTARKEEHARQEKDLLALNERRSRSEAAHNDLNREYNRLRSAMDQLDGRLKRLLVTVRNQERNLARRQRRDDTADRRPEERQLTETRQQIDELRAEQSKLEKEYASAGKNRSAEERTLTALRREISGQKSQLDRARRAMDSAERQFRHLDGILKQYRSRLASAQESVAERRRYQLR